jgi:selenide,water dikinase
MQEAIGWMVTLNDSASAAMVTARVHAATDITGYGLIGHAAEMSQASDVALHIDADRVPLMSGVLELIDRGVVPTGTRENAALHADSTAFTGDISDSLRILLSDAQTSGGLLISMSAETLPSFERMMSGAHGLCSVIGTVRQGRGITVNGNR